MGMNPDFSGIPDQASAHTVDSVNTDVMYRHESSLHQPSSCRNPINNR